MISLCLEKVVVEWIEINIESDGAAGQKARPLPSIIFGIQQEIGGDNCHANSHHNQNEKHEKHKSVHVVDLVGPKWGEHKVPEQKRI